MYSAILLAGYNNKRAVEKYSRIVERDYGEHFIETGYKPLLFSPPERICGL